MLTRGNYLTGSSSGAWDLGCNVLDPASDICSIGWQVLYSSCSVLSILVTVKQGWMDNSVNIFKAPRIWPGCSSLAGFSHSSIWLTPYSSFFNQRFLDSQPDSGFHSQCDSRHSYSDEWNPVRHKIKNKKLRTRPRSHEGYGHEAVQLISLFLKGRNACRFQEHQWPFQLCFVSRF